jgi:hypothetical protein
MKIYQFLFVLFTFTSIHLNAQTAEFRVGEPYDNVNSDNRSYVEQDGQILAIKVYRSDEVTLQKFDAKNLKELSSKEFELPKKAKLEGIHSFARNHFLFYSLRDKSADIEQLFVQSIDFSTGEFTGNAKLVFNINGELDKAFYGGLSNSDNKTRHRGWGTFDKFNIMASHDGRKILIQYRREKESRDDIDVIGFGLFDADMNKLSAGELKMPETTFGMTNLDYGVDGAGNAYALSVVYLNEKRSLFIKEAPSYRLELLKFDLTTKEISKTNVKLGDVILNEIAMFPDKSGDIICAGYYGKAKNYKTGNADGAFMFRIDEFGNPSDVQYYEIPLEVLNQFKSNSVKKKNKRKDDKDKAEFEDLVMRELHVMEDGSILLIGEQYYVVERVSTDANGRTTRTYTYYYNDIFAVKINADGDLAWMRKLPKYQSTGFATGGSLSFNHFYGEGAHYFLYMDDTKNLDLTPDDRPKKYSDGENGSFSVYKVDDESGKVSKVFVFTLKDVNGMKVKEFRVNQIVQIAPNEFAVEFYKKSLNNDDVLIGVKVVN